MSPATAVVHHPAKKSFADWLIDHLLEIFLIVYGLWIWLPCIAMILLSRIIRFFKNLFS